MKKIASAVLGFIGLAGLCVEGGIDILPLQVGAIVCLAIALTLSGAFKKEYC